MKWSKRLREGDRSQWQADHEGVKVYIDTAVGKLYAVGCRHGHDDFGWGEYEKLHEFSTLAAAKYYAKAVIECELKGEEFKMGWEGVK